MSTAPERSVALPLMFDPWHKCQPSRKPIPDIAAPKGAPVAVVGKLNDAISAILINSKVAKRLAELGGAPLVLSPAAFGKLIVEETAKWGKVIKAANIKAE